MLGLTMAVLTLLVASADADAAAQGARRGRVGQAGPLVRGAKPLVQVQRQQDRLYDTGLRLLDAARWDEAIRLFTQVVNLKGSRADAALYWTAYAQNRLGQRAESLQTITELLKRYPNSRYTTQARALDVEVRGDAGQPVRPEAQSDEELKIIALQALQRTDPERAIPMLEGILRGSSTPGLKTRALFVLAQSGTPRARQTLVEVARGTVSPELQERAIQYLGARRDPDNRTLLSEIYGASTDVEVKRRVLRAFTMMGDKERVLAAAADETAPELRAEAVRQLGALGAQAELAQLYEKESTVEVKRQILQSMLMGGESARLVQLARSEPNAELRRLAVRNLGVMGAQRTGSTLVEMYNSDKDPEIRRAVTQALVLQNNAEALVALARKETDPAMKRDIVEKLSLMRNQVATDYLLELLK
jgi:HEAT repeat protein